MADEEYYSIEELKALRAERARKREEGLLSAEKTVFDVTVEHALTDPKARIVKSSGKSFVIFGARAPRGSGD